MTTDERTSTINEMVVDRAEKSYVLADSSKFNKTSFIRYASLEQIDTVFTDSGVTEDAVKSYSEAGARIEIVGT
jgi:DeoR/GlpR family transcriptional regulator of sugar metabolism